jgi:hypothetical protein
MMTFEIYAQSYTTAQQVRREVEGSSEFDALQVVFAELDAAGYYVISAKRLEDRP